MTEKHRLLNEVDKNTTGSSFVPVSQSDDKGENISSRESRFPGTLEIKRTHFNRKSLTKLLVTVIYYYAGSEKESPRFEPNIIGNKLFIYGDDKSNDLYCMLKWLFPNLKMRFSMTVEGRVVYFDTDGHPIPTDPTFA